MGIFEVWVVSYLIIDLKLTATDLTGKPRSSNTVANRSATVVNSLLHGCKQAGMQKKRENLFFITCCQTF